MFELALHRANCHASVFAIEACCVAAVDAPIARKFSDIYTFFKASICGVFFLIREERPLLPRIEGVRSGTKFFQVFFINFDTLIFYITDLDSIFFAVENESQNCKKLIKF